MNVFWFLFLLALLVIGAWFWSKRRARTELLTTPLTAAQRDIVATQVPLTKKLPPDLHDKLDGKINLFLHQVDFIGCDGLEVTEDMELSIAAQACLLVVNSDRWYTNLRTILIYPGAFKSRQQKRNGYVITEKQIVRTGESWARGPVVLSWAHSQQGALDETDGHNVVLHEFAHQIDNLSGHTDGAPPMNKGQSFAEWAQVFTEAYQRHAHKVSTGQHTLIDAYGAEGQEEFFAVVSEVFFERPAALKADEPLVYGELSTLYQLDPVTWHQGGTA